MPLDRRLVVFLFASLMLMTDVSAAPSCEPGREIWASDAEDGLRTINYMPEEASPETTVIFEGWIGSEIIWRIKGSQLCSNGVVFCDVEIPLIGGGTIDAPIESIYNESTPLFIVYAQLRQFAYRAQNYDERSIRAEFFQMSASKVQNDINLPSVYRYIGCQKGNELDAGKK